MPALCFALCPPVRSSRNNLIDNWLIHIGETYAQRCITLYCLIFGISMKPSPLPS